MLDYLLEGGGERGSVVAAREAIMAAEECVASLEVLQAVTSRAGGMWSPTVV